MAECARVAAALPRAAAAPSTAVSPWLWRRATASAATAASPPPPPSPSPPSASSSAAAVVGGGEAAAAMTTAKRSSPLAAVGSDAGVPALNEGRRNDAFGISYRGPIEEDVEGGGRHASVVSKMWSNIPAHIRASFQAHNSLDSAPKGSVPQLVDSAMSRAKELVATTGFAPSSWTPPGATSIYYEGRYPLAPYRKGQTAAYNYPSVLIPRESAHRIPMDMYVGPVFQTSDPDHKARARDHPLFPRLQGKTTLLFCFSAQPLSGLFTGIRRWFDLVGEEFQSLKNTQVLKLHCEEGWLNRRTHALTKFHLRRQVNEEELFTTFVYRGKWKWDMARAMHLYDKELPVVLLVDSLGYIRWHAVGLPTDEATALFRSLSRRLAAERRSHV